jgi:hypothetical protein
MICELSQPTGRAQQTCIHLSIMRFTTAARLARKMLKDWQARFSQQPQCRKTEVKN